VEELKGICEFVDIEYLQIMGSVYHRWLSLQSAVTRVIGMLEGVKLYFISQENA
jgi:hypothetical protein